MRALFGLLWIVVVLAAPTVGAQYAPEAVVAVDPPHGTVYEAVGSTLFNVTVDWTCPLAEQTHPGPGTIDVGFRTSTLVWARVEVLQPVVSVPTANAATCASKAPHRALTTLLVADVRPVVFVPNPVNLSVYASLNYTYPDDAFSFGYYNGSFTINITLAPRMPWFGSPYLSVAGPDTLTTSSLRFTNVAHAPVSVTVRKQAEGDPNGVVFRAHAASGRVLPNERGTIPVEIVVPREHYSPDQVLSFPVIVEVSPDADANQMPPYQGTQTVRVIMSGPEANIPSLPVLVLVSSAIATALLRRRL